MIFALGGPMRVQEKNRRHVAVLDPDPDLLDYVKRILSDRFKVSAFTQVSELDSFLGESPLPDLLLMDWHVTNDQGEENSMDLLAKSREERPTLPVIMFACSAELKEVVAATRMGAADVILKPFTKKDLDHAIEQCLAGPAEKSEEDTCEIPLNENISFVRCCKRMIEIESQCSLVARADIPVLILGES